MDAPSYVAASTALELIAHVLYQPDEPVTIVLRSHEETTQVLASLAGIAAAYLSELHTDSTDIELANSMRSTAGLLREIESIG